MIDPADRQTQPLPLDEQPAKRKRGRPATGQALSNAERQRRYREAQKAQRNENMHKDVAEGLRAELADAIDRAEKAEAEVGRWKRLATMAERARQTVASELEQRNDNELMKRVELAEAERNAMGKELAKAKAKAAKAGPRKHRDDAPLKTILIHHNQMEDRRKSGELKDIDALWRFVGATLQVIEQHGLTAPK